MSKLDRTKPAWFEKYYKLLTAKFSTYRDFVNDPLLEELAKEEGLALEFPSVTPIQRIQRAAFIIAEAKSRYHEDVSRMYEGWLSKAPDFLRMKHMNHIGERQIAAEKAAEKNSGPKKSKPVQRVKGSRRVDTGFAWTAESASTVEVRNALGCGETTFKSYEAKLPASLRPIAASGTKSVAGKLSRSAVLMLLRVRLNAMKSRVRARRLAGNILAKQDLLIGRFYWKRRAQLERALRPFLD